MISIGYWWSDHEPDLPMPVATDATGDVDVINYLESAEVLHSWRGISHCRLCAGFRANGSTCLSDGVYQWPAGLAHYVKEHGVQLDPEFIKHIGEQL